MEIPIVSQIYFITAFLTTAGCAMDLISPYSLYFNFDLIFFEGQVWRLISSFMIFELFSFSFTCISWWVIIIIYIALLYHCMQYNTILHINCTTILTHKLHIHIIQVRYCRLLEEGDFRGKTVNFVLMLFFGIFLIAMVAPLIHTHNFLGSALTFMMTYA